MLSLARNTTSSSTTVHDDDVGRRKRARFLVGIFCQGLIGAGRPIKRRRKVQEYLNLVRDERICPLPSRIEKRGVLPPACEFIYTFVAGRDDDESLPTELVQDGVELVNKTLYEHNYQRRHADHDIVFLNIKENMNYGKSTTWFKYSSQIMDKYDIDYSVKCDIDTLIVLDRFFEFTSQYLPPYPGLVYVGRLQDKAYWLGSKVFETDTGHETVGYLRRRGIVQVYMAGEIYALSKDLAKWVSEVPIAQTAYFEGVEDHDVGMRVFEHPEPIQTVRVPMGKEFWVHPAKTHAVFKFFINRESMRLKGVRRYPEDPEEASTPFYQDLLRVFGNESCMNCSGLQHHHNNNHHHRAHKRHPRDQMERKLSPT